MSQKYIYIFVKQKTTTNVSEKYSYLYETATNLSEKYL